MLNMSLGERWANEVRGAMAGAFLALYVGLLTPILRDGPTGASARPSYTIPIFLIEISPDLLTIVGLVATTVFAGPLGFIGFVMETSAAGTLFDTSTTATQGDIWQLLFGGLIVVIGNIIWKARYWIDIIVWFVSSNSSSSRGRYR